MKRHQKYLIDHAKPLAQEQPFPNKYALSFPTVIALRPKAHMIGALYIVLLPVAFVLAGMALWALIHFFTTPYDAYHTGDDPFFAAITGSVALYLGILTWFLYSHTRYWIKLTEDGLEARFRGRKMHIAWRDARSFSVRSGNSGRQRIYTLSGEREHVTWLQFLSESPSGLYQTVPSFDLYRWQSHCLLQVIVGQTGLPLYDLCLPADT